MGIYGWMFHSEERISAKVGSWSVEGPGDQTNAMEVGVGVAVDRGLCRLEEGPSRLLEGLPLGRNSVGQWQSCYGLWLLRFVKKARIHPSKAATLLVPLPSSTAKLVSPGTAFAVFLHSLRILLRVLSSTFLAPPTGCPVVFPTLNSTPAYAFFFFFFF